jgi:hypothetical protein
MGSGHPVFPLGSALPLFPPVIDAHNVRMLQPDSGQSDRRGFVSAKVPARRELVKLMVGTQYPNDVELDGSDLPDRSRSIVQS